MIKGLRTDSSSSGVIETGTTSGGWAKNGVPKSETMIPAPFPFSFVILLPFSPHYSVWSSLD